MTAPALPRPRLRPYPAYKDSGVPWFGEVPEHWDILPLKQWVSINPETLEETTDEDYRFDYIDIGSVGTGRLTHKPQSMRFGSAPSRARRIVRPGDTIVSTVRTYLKAIFHIPSHENDLIVSTGFAVLHPDKNVDQQYLSYVIESPSFIEQVIGRSIGVTYPAIAETVLGTLSVAISAVAEEQRAIAAFLNHFDRRIYRLIRAKQRLIALLNEQKQAIIHHAVTRGLDPNVRLKPSGIDWLGDIPEHWAVRRLKWLSTLHRGYDLPADAREPGEFPVISSGGVIDSHSAYMVKGPGVVTGRYGSTGAVFCVEGDYWPHNTALYVSEFHENTPRFVYYVLQVIAIGAHSGKSAVPGIDRKDVHEIRVAVPPKDEQCLIAAYIDTELKELGDIVAKTKQEIGLLREYRTRLIADVVTGKLDVRGVELPAIEDEVDMGDEGLDLDELEADGLADSEEEDHVAD